VELRQLEQEEAANARLTAQQQERLLTSQRELERFRNLLAQKAGRESDVSRAELEVQQFQEGLIRLENERDLFPIRRQQLETRASSHRSDLALAVLELEKAHVRAPFTAVISRVMVEEGQYVRSGDPLVQLTDALAVEVPIPVNLTDAAQIEALLQQGTPPRAELVPDEGALFRTGPRWVGQVTRVAPVADERTRTVNVFVVVDNRDSRDPLRPGTFVFARIAAEVIPPEAGFLVPRDALVNDAIFLAEEFGTGTDQAVDTSRSARRVPIHVVRTMQSFALVQGDLESGDEIVMTNLDVITDGSLLDVRTSHTLASELKRLKVGYLAPAVPPTAE
jgi:multidrug efflux pump subunit AcrA (membrane-fusion protein)